MLTASRHKNDSDSTSNNCEPGSGAGRCKKKRERVKSLDCDDLREMKEREQRFAALAKRVQLERDKGRSSALVHADHNCIKLVKCLLPSTYRPLRYQAIFHDRYGEEALSPGPALKKQKTSASGREKSEQIQVSEKTRGLNNKTEVTEKTTEPKNSSKIAEADDDENQDYCGVWLETKQRTCRKPKNCYLHRGEKVPSPAPSPSPERRPILKRH